MSVWSKTKKIYWIWIVCFLGMVFVSGYLHLLSRDYGGAWTKSESVAQMKADGAQLYRTNGCADCHGVSGDEPILDQYPKLRGQNAKYTFQQLKDMKSGKRNNGMSGLMRVKLMELTEPELKAISAFLANQ